MTISTFIVDDISVFTVMVAAVAVVAKLMNSRLAANVQDFIVAPMNFAMDFGDRLTVRDYLVWPNP